MTQVESLATTVTGLVVTPSMGGVAMSFTTGTTVRAQLQIGTTSGTYPQKFTIESAARTVHQLSGYGLSAGTTYHYVIQFYDHNANLLDATTDATFATSATPAPSPASQSLVNGPPAGGAISVNTAAAASVGGSATSTIAQDANTVSTHGASGVTMAGGKLTVNQAGFYAIFASIQTAAVITASPSYVRLLLGGAQNVGSGAMFALGAGSSGNSSYLGNLAAGTTIEVQVVNGTATATTVSTGSIAVAGIA